MKLQYRLIRLILLSLAVSIGACSGGPPEKPPLDSISSPARLLDQGIQHYNNDNYPKAIHKFEKALLQYRSIDNQTGIANSCLNLAKSYMAINNNLTAAEYLKKADQVIEQAQLDQLQEHLRLLSSSLAIKDVLYDQALLELEAVLDSDDVNIRLAALKNRTSIAFIKNDSDRQQWLQQYKTLQSSNPGNTSSHLARILRYEVTLTDDEDKKVQLLSQSLSISQNMANRTAIAATLSQWADLDASKNKFEAAEEKYLRALFIRHQLGDVKNSIVILKQLKDIYQTNAVEKETLAENWIKKLSNGELDDWENLFSDFDTYPLTRH